MLASQQERRLVMPGDQNSGPDLEEAPVLIGDAGQLKFEDRGGRDTNMRLSRVDS